MNTSQIDPKAILWLEQLCNALETEEETQKLGAHIKNSLLESSEQWGARLSEFKLTIGSSEEFDRNDPQNFWCEFVWLLDEKRKLRLTLDSVSGRAYLTQTVDGKPDAIPLRWGKEYPPPLQFSSDGICWLSSEDVLRIAHHFNLPQPYQAWEGKVNGKVKRFIPKQPAKPQPSYKKEERQPSLRMAASTTASQPTRASEAVNFAEATLDGVTYRFAQSPEGDILLVGPIPQGVTCIRFGKDQYTLSSTATPDLHRIDGIGRADVSDYLAAYRQDPTESPIELG